MTIRHKVGTRFTTGCGHSWKRHHPKWRIHELMGCTTDCPQCGAELIIPASQFQGQQLDGFPAEVHAPLFHKYLHQLDPDWPEDGAGTGYVEFPAGSDG